MSIHLSLPMDHDPQYGTQWSWQTPSIAYCTSYSDANDLVHLTMTNLVMDLRRVDDYSAMPADSATVSCLHHLHHVWDVHMSPYLYTV